MKPMTGILLMTAGAAVFAAGLFIYLKAQNKGNTPPASQQLEKVIEMAIADGRLTNNERSLIRQLASEKGLDSESIIRETETRIAGQGIVPETELVDINKKKGDDFEKFVVQKFDRAYFRITEWAGDKYVDGIYADTTPQPDIVLEFKMKEHTEKLAVECKWRSKCYRNGVEIATTEQLARYKEFEEKNNLPVFIAIGIGGLPASPEQLFVVPLAVLGSGFISGETLARYQKRVETNFYFDRLGRILK